MKLHILDVTTKKPLMNTKVQLQVKGRDSGFLTLMTDGTGMLILDDKYEGQQIMSPTSAEQTWIIATDGASVSINTKMKSKTKETHSSK